MKKIIVVLIVVLQLVLFFALVAIASDGEKRQSGTYRTDEKKQTDGHLVLNYRPPKRGAPAGRVGGGTRGVENTDFILVALVPDHVGLTSKSRPSLCWYISKPIHARFEITINDENSIKPMVEKQLSWPEKGGIYCVTLSELGIKLQVSAEYQWFIAAVLDPEQRSRDIISGGFIMFVEPPQNVTEDLSKTGGIRATAIYAEQGFWYDAISSITELITNNPDDTTLFEQRLSLLQQVDLSEIVGGIR